MDYQLDGLWYTVIERAPDWFQAEIWGQYASGRTPEEAIRHARALHEPSVETLHCNVSLEEESDMSEKEKAARALVKHLQHYYKIAIAWTDTETLYDALEKSGYHYNPKGKVWEKG